MALDNEAIARRKQQRLERERRERERREREQREADEQRLANDENSYSGDCADAVEEKIEYSEEDRVRNMREEARRQVEEEAEYERMLEEERMRYRQNFSGEKSAQYLSTYANPKLTRCRKCNNAISKSDKICPHCGAKLKSTADSVGFAILGIFLFVCLAGFYSKLINLSSINSYSNSNSTVYETPSVEQKAITYTPVTIDEMYDLMDKNALKAEQTYQDEYLEITGTLGTIDSDGEYFCLNEIGDKWGWDNIHCKYTSFDQINYIAECEKGDTITIRCHITSVGEIIGYSADVDEIVIDDEEENNA